MAGIAQVTVIVAAGNSAVDSCLMSPGNVNGTLNVAASDLGPQKFNGPQSDATDSIYQYSNTGSCVDLFAPGTNILAACGGAGDPPAVPLQERKTVMLL